MDLQTVFAKLLVVIAFGALIGLDRDDSWKNKEDLKEVDKSAKTARKKFSFIDSNTPASGLGGVRTYVLISLLGAIAGLAYYYGVYPLTWIISVGFVLFILISFILNYFDKNTFGLTTEISLVLNFSLGLLLFATDISMKVIIMIAALDVVILTMRRQMRSVVSKFSGEEIVATIKFVLIALVLLVFMPNEMYGLADIPFLGGLFENLFSPEFLEATVVFNPYQLWFVVAFVLSLNYVGYFMTRSLGSKKGLNVVGLLGGLFSSTAVTESMARHSKEVKSSSERDSYITAAILANVTSFFRILLISLIINFALGMALVIPMVVMGVSMLLWILLTSFRDYQKGRRNKLPTNEEDLDEAAEELGGSFTTPFSLRPALMFASLYLLVNIVSNLALYFFGDSGYLVASMVAALSGLDAVTITTSSLVGNEITVQVGMIVLVVAACVNLLVKVMFATISGDRYFQRRILMIFIATIIAGMIAMLFMISF